MRNLFAVIFLLLLFSSCNRKDQIIIKGKISDSSFPKIYLLEMNLQEFQFVDSLKLSGDGSFKFKIKTHEPGFYLLLAGNKNFITLLGEPGEKIKVRIDGKNFTHYTVEGSKGSEQIKFLSDKLVSTKLSIDSIRNIYKTKEGQPGFDTISKSLDQKYVNIIKDQRRFSMKFIIEHIQSLACIVALYQELDPGEYVLNQNKDIQFLKIVSDTLKKYYPNSKYVVSLWNDRERLLAKMSLMKIQSLKLKPMAYPEIALPSVDGDTIKLSSLKGKCKLINFWSMNDEQSVEAFGNVIKIYNEYHKKGFEIYNIALDEDISLWSDFIKKNKIPGIQVIDSHATKSYYARLYNVTKLPASYLIDKENNIVGKDLYGNDLVDKLDEIIR